MMSAETTARSGKIQSALEGALLVVDFFLKLEDGVKKGFWTRRAAGNVNINGNDLIAALDDGVIVENAAGSGASAHGDNPLGLGHLIVKLADHRCHFLRDAAGDNHQIGLAGRGAENFGAKARDVKASSGHGHHFNGAASQSEPERPDRTLARPIYSLIERGEDNAFVLEKLAEVVGFGQRDVFAERCTHGVSSTLFSHSGRLETNC